LSVSAIIKIGGAVLQRKIYLKKLDVSDALEKYKAELQQRGFFFDESEIIQTRKSARRVLAEAVYAKRNVPAYNSAAMDGIAVRSVDTAGASKVRPKILQKNQFEFINTGNPMKIPFDSVIMIENVHVIDEDHVQIFESIPPFHNVRLIGEDVCEQDMIFTRYHRLRPYDVALLLAAGVFEVKVLKKMKAIVIPTGGEVVQPEDEIDVGAIPETNSVMIKAYLEELDVDVNVNDVVPDSLDLISETILKAVESYDLIFLNAGSSAGSFDYSYHALEQLGKVVVHGLNVRPGKPTILGIIRNKPVICLPGYPGSCYVILENIVKPLINEKYRIITEKNLFLEASSLRRVVSSISEDEFITVSLAKIKDRYVFVPLKRGAASMDALSKMSGTVVVQKGVELLDEGDKVTVGLNRSLEEIDKNILFVGSHDPLISIIADLLKQKDFSLNMSIVNAGSMGAVAAVAKNCAHIGGIHLFDPVSGEYNVPYLKRYLPQYILMKFVKRNQGLIVQKGNPKKIENLFDLTRKDIRFVNRQRAAGTRILLDYHLSKLGIDPSQINGYEDEEFTHINLALKIKKGMADVGLGIAFAAKIMDLDFIPLIWEDYDLLVLEEFFNDDRFQIIMDLILSKNFCNSDLIYQGYDLSSVGKIIRGENCDQISGNNNQ